MIFISSKNSSITKNSPYVEIENQPNGNSAYQELTVTAYTVSGADCAKIRQRLSQPNTEMKLLFNEKRF